jgi:hypothetical protein
MRVRKNALCDYCASSYNILMHNFFVKHCYIGAQPKYKCYDILLIRKDAEYIVKHFRDVIDFDSVLINIVGCSEYNELHHSISKLVVYQQFVYECQEYFDDHLLDFSNEKQKELQKVFEVFHKDMGELTQYLMS